MQCITQSILLVIHLHHIDSGGATCLATAMTCPSDHHPIFTHSHTRLHGFSVLSKDTTDWDGAGPEPPTFWSLDNQLLSYIPPMTIQSQVLQVHCGLL